MDLRLWDEFRDVFTDDLELYVENTKTPRAEQPTVRGADTLVSYLAAADPRKVTVHQGHMPEIEFLDADNATGIWAMFDWVDDPAAASRCRASVTTTNGTSAVQTANGASLTRDDLDQIAALLAPGQMDAL